MKWLCVAVLAASWCVVWSAEDEDSKNLPEGTGKAATAKICLECHTSSPFRQRRLDEDAWSNMVYEMIDRGAKPSDEETTAIVAYLVKNFGKDAKVVVNTAPLGELKMVLGFTTAECEAIIQGREKQAYKSWEDVAKVVDAAKVEVKKGMMAF